MGKEARGGEETGGWGGGLMKSRVVMHAHQGDEVC